MKTVTLTVAVLVLSLLPGCARVEGWFSKETPPAEPTNAPAATPAVVAVDPLPELMKAYWAAEDSRTHASAAFDHLPAVPVVDAIEYYVVRFQMYDATEQTMFRAADVAAVRSGDERLQWARLVRQLAGQTEFLAADLKRHYDTTAAYQPGANIDAALWARHVLPPGTIRERNKQAVVVAIDKATR